MKRVQRIFLLGLVFVLLASLLGGCRATPKQQTVPMLLYHHLAEQGSGESILSIDKFRSHMELLKQNGYQPIPLKALADFVDSGKDLPEKAVVITFDDGYYSNYQYAYPILKEYQFPATIFTIGCSVGHMEFYKDTHHAITPHFGAAEIREMCGSGLIEVQSHTYDFHQWAPFEKSDTVRGCILPLEGESDADYTAALTADHQKNAALLEECGAGTPFALAFPGGEWSQRANEILTDAGIRITVTTSSETVNTVTEGDPASRLSLGRLYITEATSDQTILEYLK